MNEEHLEALSYEIDDELYRLSQKYKCSSLSLSSIILARLMRMNMESNSIDDFNSILLLAVNRNKEKKVLQ